MAYPREIGGLPRARRERRAALRRAPEALERPSTRGSRATPGRPRARALVPAVAAALALCACEPYVAGNGVFLEEDRSAQVGAFVGLAVEDEIEATVTSGVQPQSVVVSGDANVVPYVRTEVTQLEVPQLGASVPVLHVWVDLKEFDRTMPVRAAIGAADVKYVSVLEAAKLDLRGEATGDLVVEGRGGAEVVVRGDGGTGLDATLDDAALDAGSYEVQAANVALTARSRIELHADGAVIGSASGGSEVDNQLGAGTCAVSKDATSIVTCQRYAPAGP